jgi:hypothetical protein
MPREGYSTRLYHQEVADKYGHNAAMFLAQVAYWWKTMGGPFYKGIEEREDSWKKELGLSRYKIKKITNIFATKVRQQYKAEALIENGSELKHIIVYYKESGMPRRYYFNEKLYNELRENLRLAKREKLPVGQPRETSGSIYTKNNKEIREENKKESTKEKIKELLETTEEISVSEKELEKRAKVKEKANKPTVRAPQKIIDDNKGARMPIDFSLKPSIMAEALEKYPKEWIEKEFLGFKNHFTNKNPKERRLDWNRQFVDKWLPQGWQWKLENDAKYGINKDANTDRFEGLARIAGIEFSEESVGDLSRSLAERYAFLDDGGDSS